MLAAQPLARGVAQSEVWSEIGEKQERMSVASPTGANRDTFEAYGDRLRKLEDAFPPEPGQCGAVLAIGDALCLDFVSRPAAFTVLWPKLRAGYLLDALERLDQRPADIERIAGFVDEVADAPATRGAVGRARRGRAPARPRRDRLRARARRRADPAERVHELGRRAAGVRADRAAEPAALRRLGGLRGCEQGPYPRARASVVGTPGATGSEQRVGVVRVVAADVAGVHLDAVGLAPRPA